MYLPPDLAAVLLHMWLGAIPLVAGLGALGLVELWRRRLGPALARRRRAARLAALRARLTRAHFAEAAVVALRSAAPADGGVRVALRLQVAAPDGDWPALADWLVPPSALERLQPGQSLPVLVLAGRTRRVLPNLDWGAPAGERLTA